MEFACNIKFLRYLKAIVRGLFICVRFSLCAFATNSAWSADGASFDAIGFSKDTRYFAFEQYGIQDGSGYPYSEIFVIDLQKDEWINGAPFRKRIESEEASLGDARIASASAADSLLKSLQIIDPPELLASNQATEVLVDRNSITFDRWYLSSSYGSRIEGPGTSIDNRYRIFAEVRPLPNPSNCPKENGAVQGLTLKAQSVKTGLTWVVHNDVTIPTSRNCPMSYDIQAIVASAGYPKQDRLVAIVGVYSVGFEGSNRRYMAIPLQLSE